MTASDQRRLVRILGKLEMAGEVMRGSKSKPVLADIDVARKLMLIRRELAGVLPRPRPRA